MTRPPPRAAPQATPTWREFAGGADAPLACCASRRATWPARARSAARPGAQAQARAGARAAPRASRPAASSAAATCCACCRTCRAST